MNLKSLQGPHRVTTAQMGGALPFLAHGSLGSRGVIVGQDVHSGNVLAYDPWVLYGRVLTSPNKIIMGQLGNGKSAYSKTYIYRQLAFDRHAVVIDPKDQGGQGEYTKMVEMVGGTVIRLEPGGKVRLNPLDIKMLQGVRDARGRLVRSAEQLRQDQQEILYTIVEAAIDASLDEDEKAALRVTMDDVQAEVGEWKSPTLERVADRLLSPTEASANRLKMDRPRLLDVGRQGAYALSRLCEGELAGMFNGETSGDLDFGAGLVSLDMSAIFRSKALGILMVCAQSRLQWQAMADRSHRRILVIDEGWAVLNKLSVARWLASSIKLARSQGVQVILILHRPSDLLAAGALGSEQNTLAQGMLSDSQTQVIFGMEPKERDRAQELLHLTDAVADAIGKLQPHVAIMRLPGHTFQFRHRLLSDDEVRMVETSEYMAA